MSGKDSHEERVRRIPEPTAVLIGMICISLVSQFTKTVIAKCPLSADCGLILSLLGPFPTLPLECVTETHGYVEPELFCAGLFVIRQVTLIHSLPFFIGHGRPIKPSQRKIYITQ